MSKLNFELRSAGDVVWVAFPKEKEGDILCSLFGPVTICEATLQVTHKKGFKPVVKATYRANSLEANYGEEYIYESFAEAAEAVQAQVAALKAKREEHDRLHS